MNIYIRKIDYQTPQDDLPAGGIVEFDDDDSEEVSLEEYGHDIWVFLEGEIAQTINGFEASFTQDFSGQAYQFVRNEAGDGFVIFDVTHDSAAED